MPIDRETLERDLQDAEHAVAKASAAYTEASDRLYVACLHRNQIRERLEKLPRRSSGE